MGLSVPAAVAAGGRAWPACALWNIQQDTIVHQVGGGEDRRGGGGDGGGGEEEEEVNESGGKGMDLLITTKE